MNTNGESFEDYKRKMAQANTKPESEKPEGEDLGPCASRPGNKWIECLHVYDGPKPVESFQYRWIAARSVFEPTRFWVVFKDGDEKWKLTVIGRNLWAVYNYICQGRLEWIRKADRSFGDDNDKKPVITGISVQQVEEPG